MKSTDFFKTDYVDQASYDNLRKIASAIDGLKNSNRKVIHTVLDKNIKDLIKVQQLAARASEYTDYLHGSLDSVIVSLGQTYVDTNQLPLLTKKGNFGTRAIPSPAASRYIYAKASNVLPYLFVKEDRPNLIHQEFEGLNIEPRYFVPTLPMIFVNGNRGVSSGFAQYILTRDIKDLIEVLALRLSGKSKDFKSFDRANVYVKGFNGKIYPNDESSESYKWVVEGSLEITRADEITINELPLGTNLMGYVDFLDELKEKKKIKSYKDLCQGDDFKFKISFGKGELKSHTNESLMTLFKLRTTITENFTSLGVDNKIKEFVKPSQILEHYYEVKLSSMNDRKQMLLSNFDNDISKKSEQYRFIGMVLDNTLDLKSLKTKEVFGFLEQHNFLKIDGSYNYLVTMPVSSLQKDKMESLKSEIEKLNNERKSLENTSPEKLWLSDIQTLVKNLKE